MNHFSILRFLIITMAMNIYSNIAECQAPPDCSSIKNGVFYSYPKNTADRYITYRENEVAKEYDLVKGDSTSWKVDWKDNCSYTLKYISGSAKLSKEVADFLKKHVLFYTVQSVTSDYYLFAGYVDNRKGVQLNTDTMWLHEKVNFKPNKMFDLIPDRNALKKAKFSDTSQYALVYLYRPGKLTNSIGPGYLVRLDDLPMAIMKNKSGYVFKVFQPGTHTFTSGLGKDEVSTQLKIETGKTYYLKAAIHWGIHSWRNYKLEIKEMEPSIGKQEFDDVDFF
jgi:hypothetical protein